MLSLSEFITKYTGQKCGDTAANTGQCVGLIEVWIDNLGLPHDWGNAIDLLNNADKNHFDVIRNVVGDASVIPQPGDIMVWEATPSLGIGSYGHTDICVSSNANNFQGFDQNWGTPNTPRLITHTYTGVIGWLRPKVSVPIPPPQPVNNDPALTPDEAKSYYETYAGREPENAQVTQNRHAVELLKGLCLEVKSDRDNLRTQVSQLTTQITQLQADRNNSTSQVTQLNSDITQLKGEYDQSLSDVSDLKNTINQNQTTISTLQQKLTDSQNQNGVLLQDATSWQTLSALLKKILGK